MPGFFENKIIELISPSPANFPSAKTIIFLQDARNYYTVFKKKSYNHRQENRRLVGHFYDMKNRFWAVGCGLGWAVE